RLAEPAESEISRPLARHLRAFLPGRGIVAPGNVFHTALPRLDGAAETENLGKAQQAVVDELAASWSGPTAAPLRVLADVVTPEELQRACEDFPGGTAVLPDSAVPIGIRDFDLSPAVLDLEANGPHFLVYGDPGSGKTTFLASWMRSMARRRSAWDVRFIVVDYRRGLLGAVDEDYVGASAGDPASAASYLQQVAEKLKVRVPPAGITPRELKGRDWWSGPELYLVVDDYDLVVGSGTMAQGPLTAISDYLTQGAD